MDASGIKSQRKITNGRELNLKLNRSNNFTTGLCNTFEGSDLKTFFFELDKEHLVQRSVVEATYEVNELDYLCHRTGGGGLHYLSPTMISRDGWKRMHQSLRDINPKCPMTTLRMQPNKYPNEDLIWYLSHCQKWNAEPKNNNQEMCQYLNKIFGCKLEGTATGSIKIVRYPLPLLI